MADTSDLDELARRYLDFWQGQLADLAADEDLAAAMAESLGLISTGAATIATMAQAATANRGHTQHGGAETGENSENATNGAAAAVAAPHDADVGLDVLARRVADLEQRLATLEAASGGDGKRPPGRSRRR